MRFMLGDKIVVLSPPSRNSYKKRLLLMFLTLSTQFIKQNSRAWNAICFFICCDNRFLNSRDFKAEISSSEHFRLPFSYTITLALESFASSLLCNYYTLNFNLMSIDIIKCFLLQWITDCLMSEYLSFR